MTNLDSKISLWNHFNELYLITFLCVFVIAWWRLFTKAETSGKQKQNWYKFSCSWRSVLLLVNADGNSYQKSHTHTHILCCSVRLEVSGKTSAICNFILPCVPHYLSRFFLHRSAVSGLRWTQLGRLSIHHLKATFPREYCITDNAESAVQGMHWPSSSAFANTARNTLSTTFEYQCYSSCPVWREMLGNVQHQARI